jgi:hypothetical protein
MTATRFAFAKVRLKKLVAGMSFQAHGLKARAAPCGAGLHSAALTGLALAPTTNITSSKGLATTI